MPLLRSVELHQLRNSEYLQFITGTITLCEEAIPAHSVITPLLAALSDKRAAIAALYGKDRASSLTKKIAQLDARRDRAVVGMWIVADGYRRHFDATKQAAGKLLSHTINLYRGIADKNYNEESASLTHLVAGLTSKPELSAAVSVLNLSDWVAELGAAHTAFMALYNQRITQKAATRSDTNIKTLRPATNQLWYKLRNKISGYYIVEDGAEPWATAVARLNTHIMQYAATVKLREARGGKGEDSEAGG